KEILEVIDPIPVINEELLELSEWLSETTFCTLFDAISVVLPKPYPKRLPKLAVYEKNINIESIVLSQEQNEVFETITVDNISKCYLLHGVTGSGKTSVFKHLINYYLNQGKTAMLLVPEIALTPQMLKQFTALFGETVAVLHSGLTNSQRAVEYRNIEEGKKNIVIGTRSAVFAPLENIGIIIIDEEQEHTYKSESAPRYHTTDVAKHRCKTHNAKLLLASATPSLESFYYANKGIYTLLTLEKRYGDVSLPMVQVVDMSYEEPDFSRLLLEELQKNIRNGEQSILLLNRRGYHTMIMCAHCNQPIYCKDCSLPMTFHKQTNKLLCHFCGFTREMPPQCPACGYNVLKKIGMGTQKLEEKLQTLLPNARILRMDADTITSKQTYEISFEAFRNKEYDIMLGTQMLGKGLDFPNVTLVGIISVDKSLYYGDYKAYERTFSLITQVIGRSGRAHKKGRAVLQTFLPEHYVIQLGSQQNYKAFAVNELTLRRTLLMPPYCDICTVTFISDNDNKTFTVADMIFTHICERIKEIKPLKIFPPTRDNYYLKGGKYYWHIMMKCKNNAEFRAFLKDIIKNKDYKGVTVTIDFNGG
ncbi:MAG: primosomal protein N', partial [Oscillospiraceae bacterium]|nr:primosomal protein N' [Oscillospiraceae bacterium]